VTLGKANARAVADSEPGSARIRELSTASLPEKLRHASARKDSNPEHQPSFLGLKETARTERTTRNLGGLIWSFGTQGRTTPIGKPHMLEWPNRGVE